MDLYSEEGSGSKRPSNMDPDLKLSVVTGNKMTAAYSCGGLLVDCHSAVTRVPMAMSEADDDMGYLNLSVSMSRTWWLEPDF